MGCGEGVKTWCDTETLIAQSKSGLVQGHLARPTDREYNGYESTHVDKEKLIEWANLWSPKSGLIAGIWKLKKFLIVKYRVVIPRGRITGKSNLYVGNKIWH